MSKAMLHHSVQLCFHLSYCAVYGLFTLFHPVFEQDLVPCTMGLAKAPGLPGYYEFRVFYQTGLRFAYFIY